MLNQNKGINFSCYLLKYTNKDAGKEEKSKLFFKITPISTALTKRPKIIKKELLSSVDN